MMKLLSDRRRDEEEKRRKQQKKTLIRVRYDTSQIIKVCLPDFTLTKNQASTVPL
jgi:hypothetical protein